MGFQEWLDEREGRGRPPARGEDGRGCRVRTGQTVEDHYNTIHTEQFIEAVREAHSQGVSQDCLAVIAGVTQVRISEIVNEKSWSPKTAIWRRTNRVDKPPKKGGGYIKDKS